MSPKEKQLLNQTLSSLDRNDRDKLLKRASQLRKLANSRLSSRSRSSTEDDEDSPTTVRRQKSLDDFMWQIVSAEMIEEKSSGPTEKAVVVSVVKNGLEIILGEVRSFARPKSPSLSQVAVGDEVFVQRSGEDLLVVGIADRRTVLSRPDVDNSNLEKVVAANLDVVVVVVSVVSPPLHPRIIDRYLLAIERGGCQPALVVNKLDLLEVRCRAAELSKLDAYRGLAIPIFECVSTTGEGIAALRSFLTGKVAAFVGHSGVGKSSLVNALDPLLAQEIGAVSEGYGRGTHTTTRSTMVDLGDFRVIDTPGIRSFGIWDIKPLDLKLYFPEFQKCAPCRFRDCSHLHEPGCSVKAAAEAGSLSRARYETYRRVLETL
jgi:ribosome biogenesis GTPase